jgi:hypothetical protein
VSGECVFCVKKLCVCVCVWVRVCGGFDTNSIVVVVLRTVVGAI